MTLKRAPAGNNETTITEGKDVDFEHAVASQDPYTTVLYLIQRIDLVNFYQNRVESEIGRLIFAINTVSNLIETGFEPFNFSIDGQKYLDISTPKARELQEALIKRLKNQHIIMGCLSLKRNFFPENSDIKEFQDFLALLSNSDSSDIKNVVQYIREGSTDSTSEVKELQNDELPNAVEELIKTSIQLVDRDERTSLEADLRRVFSSVTFKGVLQHEVVTTPVLPQVAPEMYSEREDRRENPVSFIKRVYAPWLGKGLDRSHILNFDKKLYNSLNQWRLRHGVDDLDLPKKSEVVTREIERAGADGVRAARRLVQNALHRKI